MSTRIYKVKSEVKETKPGQHWSSYNVAADSVLAALVKAEKLMSKNERAQSIELLAQEG